MTTAISTREDYWTDFYSADTAIDVLQPPSQFAAFVAQEIARDSVLFDVGCGSGRDSLFFAALGFKVIAIDRSDRAIEAVRLKASTQGLQNLQAIVGDISGPVLGKALNSLDGRSACIYARFFLHAITENEQTAFFDTLSERLTTGQVAAFEFRTTADQFLDKHAPPHFRRYQPAQNVSGLMQERGFERLYTIEGQGFAKYQSEDAIVARCVFRKAS